MKYLLFILFTFSASAADWCDIKNKKTGAVLYTYKGACGSTKFGGPWGDRDLTIEAPNLTRDQEEKDRADEIALKKGEVERRLNALKARCAGASDTDIKAICDFLLAEPVEAEIKKKGN